MFSEIRKDIVCPLQLQGQLSASFLNFFTAHMFWAVVCYRGCLDDDILLLGLPAHSLKHLSCGLYLQSMDELRLLQRGRSAHKRHRRAPPRAHCGNGISHFTRRMICDIAHRVCCFLSRSRGHKDIKPLHVLFAGDLLKDILKQQFRLRHLPCPCVAACQISHGRADNLIPVPLQDLHVVLHDRIFKHICVHRRRDDLPAPACHHGCRQHIIRNAVSDLSDHIGACRGDHYHVCLLRQRHMFHTVLKIPVKCVYQTLVSGQSLKSDGIDKVHRILCHQQMYIRVQLFERARQGRGLISGDASRDPEQDCLSL